jgi:hypothetical protein
LRKKEVDELNELQVKKTSSKKLSIKHRDVNYPERKVGFYAKSKEALSGEVDEYDSPGRQCPPSLARPGNRTRRLLSNRVARGSSGRRDERLARRLDNQSEHEDKMKVRAEENVSSCMAQVQQEAWICSNCKLSVLMPDIVRDLPSNEGTVIPDEPENRVVARSSRANIRYAPAKIGSRQKRRDLRSLPKNKAVRGKKEKSLGCTTNAYGNAGHSKLDDLSSERLVLELLQRGSLLSKVMHHFEKVRLPTKLMEHVEKVVLPGKLSTAVICTVLIIVCAKQIKKFCK